MKVPNYSFVLFKFFGEKNIVDSSHFTSIIFDHKFSVINLHHFQVSPNIVRKYIGPVDIWLSILLSRRKGDGKSFCLLNLDLPKSYAAMAQHSSQWVWSVSPTLLSSI